MQCLPFKVVNSLFVYCTNSPQELYTQNYILHYKIASNMLSFHRSCAECDMYVLRLFQSHMQVCAPFTFIAICTGGCLNGGTCVLAEKCDCSKGWSGQNCELGNFIVIVL